MFVTFATTPIRLPNRLTVLLREHLRHLDTVRRYHPNEPDWLFPGVMPHHHLSAATIHGILATIRLGARQLTSSRLQHFAQILPSSVIADVVGVTPVIAFRRSVTAGGTWNTFPSARTQHAPLGAHAPGASE